MVFIKLENNMDKFLIKRYDNFPKSMKKILFKSKCRNGKFFVEKVGYHDYIVLPELNDKLLKKLKSMSEIRCWKNICISDNLRESEKFLEFAHKNSLTVMDGKWLFKNLVDQMVEYIAGVKNEMLGSQEVSILCKNLDEIMAEKIKEIAKVVKVCNVLTDSIKQYQKLEEEIYQNNGIILNVSNNYKKAILKSSIMINLDFKAKDLEKCNLSKHADIVNMNPIKINSKEFNGKNIVFYEIDMPEKYVEYKQVLEGFNSSILYESFIYKHTSYQNIKKELLADDVKVLYLKDCDGKIIKNQNLNLPKKLDKIII